MCTVNDKQETSAEDITIFKIVRLDEQGIAISEYYPEKRGSIPPWASFTHGYMGETLRYIKGETVKSPGGPGIMGLVKPVDSWERIPCRHVILKVKAGTLFRRGMDLKDELIAAEEVEVMSDPIYSRQA